MSHKKRIFVEKRGIFDVESPKVLNEIKSILPNIQSVKVFNIYDIFGLDESEFEKVVNNTFVDPVVDILHHENPAKSIYFATEFLPGQYDQRADSAQQWVFLWPDRSYVRKGLEAYFTVLIEVMWGKPRIMEVYLNSIEFGPGIYGAQAAARKNFGVDAKDLSRTQAARLAAVLPSPLRYKADTPGPYVRRRTGRIQAAAGAVRRDNLDACVLG